MKSKKIIRGLITLTLFAALIFVIIASQSYNPNNPHASIPREEWLSDEGHAFAVKNNQDPQGQCYECHVKKGLGGKAYCQSCHDQSGVEFNLPE